MVRIYQSARCSHSGFPCLRCYENQASTLVLALQRSEPWAVGSSSTLARVVRESLRGVETGVGYFKDRDAVTAGVMVTAAAQAFISAMRRPLERHRARAADAARAAAEAARLVRARARRQQIADAALRGHSRVGGRGGCVGAPRGARGAPHGA